MLKGLSAETIKPPSTSDNSLTPLIHYVGNKIRLKFSGSCLKQPKLQYTHGTIVNIYIVYELDAFGSNDNDPILKNYLVQLLSLKMKILISMDILVMELDLIEDHVFHFQVVDLVKIY